MDRLIQAIGIIVGNTPIWVFAVLAILIVLGAQALRERTVPLRRVAITPAVFITWGVISLVTKPTFSSLLVGDWLATAAIGIALAAMTVRFPRLRADRVGKRVHLPGSVQPLLRNLTVFLVKYALAVTMAITPAAREQLAFWDVAVSGLAAGYFLGWLWRLISAYRRAAAPTPALAPSAEAAS